jgi:hypothetical protein
LSIGNSKKVCAVFALRLNDFAEHGKKEMKKTRREQQMYNIRQQISNAKPAAPCYNMIRKGG